MFSWSSCSIIYELAKRGMYSLNQFSTTYIRVVNSFVNWQLKPTALNRSIHLPMPHPLIHSSVWSFTQTPIHPPTYPAMYRVIHPPTHPQIYPPTDPSKHLVISWVPPLCTNPVLGTWDAAKSDLSCPCRC